MNYLFCYSTIVFIVFDILHYSGVASEQNANECSDISTNTLRLKCQLLKEYDSEERPVKSIQDFLTINLEMYPITIDLDDLTDKLSLSTWMVMNWTDIFLTWRPEDYDGLQTLSIDCSHIWSPDLISLSELAEDPYQSIAQSACKIMSNGSINMVFSTDYSAFCTTDRTLWPYDQHACSLYLGSRSFTGPSLKFQLNEVVSDTLKKNKQWIIKDLTPKVKEYATMSKAENYSQLEFRFSLKRHASVASFCFVFPGIAMAVLVVAVLWLDVTVAERIYMFAIVIFNNVGSLQYLMYMVPPNGSNPPNLIIFFRDSIVICGICIIITIISRLLLKVPYRPMCLAAIIKFINEKDYLKTYLLIHRNETENEIKDLEDSNERSSSNYQLTLANQTRNDWWTFVTFIDRLLCITVIFLFTILLLKFYPVL